jgi:hypothetical protein
LWETIGEKPIILQIRMRNTLRKVKESVKKTSIRLESARRQKERKTEENLEQDHF